MKSKPVPTADAAHDTRGSAPAANQFESDDPQTLLSARLADYEQEVLQTSDPFAALSGLVHAELHRDAYALEGTVRRLITSVAAPSECLRQSAPAMKKYLAIVRRITRHAAEELHEHRAR